MFEKAIGNIIYMHTHTYLHTHNLDVVIPYEVIMFQPMAINYLTETSVPDRENSSLSCCLWRSNNLRCPHCLAELEAIY